MFPGHNVSRLSILFFVVLVQYSQITIFQDPVSPWEHWFYGSGFPGHHFPQFYFSPGHNSPGFLVWPGHYFHGTMFVGFYTPIVFVHSAQCFTGTCVPMAWCFQSPGSNVPILFDSQTSMFPRSSDFCSQTPRHAYWSLLGVVGTMTIGMTLGTPSQVLLYHWRNPQHTDALLFSSSYSIYDNLGYVPSNRRL